MGVKAERCFSGGDARVLRQDEEGGEAAEKHQRDAVAEDDRRRRARHPRADAAGRAERHRARRARRLARESRDVSSTSL